MMKDVLRLVTGTGIAQAVGILAAPVIARLYAPEAFGLATLFASLTLIIGVMACMRYELSIVLPEDDREAANLLGVSLLSSLLISALTVPIVLMSGPFVVRWTGIPDLAAYLWVLPVAIFLHGIYTSLNYWNTRTKNFSRLAAVQVTNQAIVTSTNLGAGFAGFATGGIMIAASIAGRVGAVAVLGTRIWRENGRFLIQSIRWRDMLAGVKRYKKFPMYSSWSALLNAVSWQLPTLMLGAFFSSAVVGFYALGFRILQMPMNLIGNAISQVFLQRAAIARTDGTLAKLVEGLFQRLVIVSLFPLLLLAIVGRDLYTVVFGENWAEAGTYAQILSVWAFFWFIAAPLSQLFTVLERQEFALKINSALLATRLLSLGIGGYQDSVYLALSLYAGTGILVYGFLSLKIMQYSGVTVKQALVIIWRSFVTFLPFGIVLLAMAITAMPRSAILSLAVIAFMTHGLIVFRRLA